jgi:hypothetical protein
MLAFFSAADATIVVGALALVGSVVTTAIGILTKRNVGTMNGKGSVVEMSEKQLLQNEELLKHHGRMLARLDAHDEKLDFYGALVLNHIATPGAHGGSNVPSPLRTSAD